MIDPTKPCVGINNFKASIHPNGGTPGQVNSVAGELIDLTKPTVSNAFISNEQSVFIRFNKNIYQTTTGNIEINSTISDFSFTIKSMEFISDHEMIIQVNEYFNLNQTYQLKLSQWVDCS